MFKLTADYWHQEARHPLWHGLKLLGVDGVVWRTPDTPENEAAFGKSRTQHGDTTYPQVQMVCQMELSSHLLVASEFDRYETNEMHLAARLTKGTPDNSITLFDKGFTHWACFTTGRTAGKIVTGCCH
ncbi:Uncharacterised protein [Serratia plymuthica]|uniref:Transposase IS4-like domain-containing protein n=1 Tax=Serratia plymuthica TaxID=82996 RepID=A0A2X4VEZ4_SERPL|nr:Uncharacterised protein [Serratia plymuthica]